MKQALLSVLGKDRPGIIAKVTGALFKNGCNLEDISMTILEGEFSMMMILSLSKGKADAIRNDIEKLIKKEKLSFFWHPFKAKLSRGEKHQKNCVSHLITAIGRDRTGIVYQISRLLWKLGLNITDLNSKILGHGKSAIYTLMLEVDIPTNFIMDKLTQPLEQLSHKLNIEIQCKRVEHIEF